jgi:hypothetical protein
MVISVWIHMFRVFMTGSYKPPREFNWVIGVILLVLTLLLSFTGYLLPWDQLAIWAITVGSNMASATPLLGIEGPGTALLKIGDIQLVTSIPRRGCCSRTWSWSSPRSRSSPPALGRRIWSSFARVSSRAT